MRAGGCTVQQTLTAEAAGVVKHAVALARQRGHAQVTPLHVAATMLAPGCMSLLRRACLKSHPHSTSHPLQCRALELCFKVALNRLPTAAGPLLQPGHPSLSNALVAALKRAQAHQRRGCLEQQQQPLLAVKVEMEQLIISILDDPSVSRVMREAGFSSTFVKNNLEDETSVSVNVNFSSSSFYNNEDLSVSRSAAKIKGLMAEAVEMGGGVLYNSSSSNYGFGGNGRINIFESPAFKSYRSSGSLKSEDVESVFYVLLGKKSRKCNSVIVGDCFLTTENVVREVMSRIERGDVPDLLRGARFITPHFSTLTPSREHTEQKLAELRRMVNNCLIEGSAIIYAGDLRWAVDNSIKCPNSIRHYCPVEHISVELGRMLGGHAESRRVWLMATASYETYLKCQKRQPSLETLWGLQAVAVPSGGLALTLQASSTTQAESKTVSVPVTRNLLWPIPILKTVNPDHELVCCSECSANFESEADSVREQEQRLVSCDGKLPLWLQQCRHNREYDETAQVETKLRDLRGKWNQRCHIKHSHGLEVQRSAQEFPLVSTLNRPSSLWCTPQSRAWSVVSSPLPSSKSGRSHQFSRSTPENVENSSIERTVSVHDSPRFDVKTTLALGFTDTSDNAADCTASSQLPRKSLRQSDHESLKELSDRLAEKVPWQREDNVRTIASAVLHCRSGMARRQGSTKSDTWLMVLGPDRTGKRKMAQALAEVIFGSQDKLLCLGCFYSQDAIFRGRTYLDRLTQAVGLNAHCVVLLEEIEQAGAVFLGAIVKAMETGKLKDSEGREVILSDTIVFMTSSLGAKYFTSSSSVKGVQFDEEKLSQALAPTSCSFKLVVHEQVLEHISGHHPCKRKAECDPMQEENTLKWRRMSPALDLNIYADEAVIRGADDQAEHNQEAGSTSGNSDVTQEPGAQINQILSCAGECFSQQFFISLDKCIVFHAFDFAQLAEWLLDRLQYSYCRATNDRGSLEVESSVLQRMVSCCWDLAPSDKQTFEKWVHEIFEAALSRMVSKHTLTKETIVKLSTAESNGGDCCYANTGLPARLEVETSAQS